MDAASPDDHEPLTRDDMRRLEARFHAWLAELAAWPALHDGRFAALTGRLDEADRRADSLAASLDSGLDTIADDFDGLDSRSDRLESRITDLRTSTVAMLRGHREATTRATVIGLAVTVSLNAVLIASAVFAVTR